MLGRDMAIDTLAYVKAAGVERRAAEAHAEVLARHVAADLVTTADLAATKADLKHAIGRLQHRLDKPFRGRSTG